MNSKQLLAEVVECVMRHAPDDGLHETTIDRLRLVRASAPAQPLPAIYEPGLALVIQGRKRATLGDEVYVYDPLHCLVISMTTIPVGQIVEASPEKPYLCLRLSLDVREMADLLLQMPMLSGGKIDESSHSLQVPRGLGLWPVTQVMLEAVSRLVRLLDALDDSKVLAPLIIREIYYRLLQGGLAQHLRALVVANSRAQRIAKAVDYLAQHYAEAIRIEDVAAVVHMSPSSLHQHFKQVTAMSPLQFQKQLRLHQARRLMLVEGVDAAIAGYRVGYVSASQFSREYRRLFGAPPKTEVRQVRG